MQMKYFSMFSGIGGFELGIGDLGQCIGYSEIDNYAISVFDKQFKGIKNYGDATKIDSRRLPDFDLLVGGFPCQAFSVAGKRRGFEEARGTLFFDIARIIADKRPGHLLLENVKGLLNHDNGKTFAEILRILSELGYDVEWQLFNSKGWGVPQRRERIYIVGHLRNQCARKILPIGTEISETVEAGDDRIAVQDTEIPYGYNRLEGLKEPITTSPAVLASDWRGLNRNQDQVAVVSVMIDNSYTKRARVYEDHAPTVRDYGSGGNKMPMVLTAHPKYGNGKRSLKYKVATQVPTIRATQHKSSDNEAKIIEGRRIRRLMPIECERLQGFPDDWTRYSVAGNAISDTQRYKMAGNAVTVNVVRAVAQELIKH